MKTLYEQGVTSAPFETLFVLGVLLFTVLAILCLIFYVMKAVALYDMAKKLKVKNAWHSFVPVLSQGLLGKTAAGNKRAVWANVLVAFSLLTGALAILSYTFGTLALIRIFFAADKAVYLGENSIEAEVEKYILLLIVPLLVTAAVGRVQYILQCLCYYKVFKIFAPKKAAVYTVFGIIFNFLMPIFLFVSRKDSPETELNNGTFSLVE